MSNGFDPAMTGWASMKKTPSPLDDVLAAKGRGRDSIIAHISPREAGILKAFGGSGKINPATGMLEFEDADSEGGQGASNAGGSDSDGPDGSSGGGASGTGDSGIAEGSGFGGADQGGLSDTAMDSPAEVSGRTGDPTGVYAMMDNIPDLDPIGSFASKYGSAGMLGYGVGGPLGAGIFMGVQGLYNAGKGMYGMTPEERSAAFAQMEKAEPQSLGAQDGSSAPDSFSAELAINPLAPKPTGLADYERTIINKPYTYNARTGTYTKKK